MRATACSAGVLKRIRATGDSVAAASMASRARALRSSCRARLSSAATGHSKMRRFESRRPECHRSFASMRAFSTAASQSAPTATGDGESRRGSPASIKYSVQASCISCATELEGMLEEAQVEAAKISEEMSSEPLERMRALLAVSRRVETVMFSPSSCATKLLLDPASPRRMEHKMKAQYALEATNQLKVYMSRMHLGSPEDGVGTKERDDAAVALAIEDFFASYRSLVWELRYMADNEKVINAVAGEAAVGSAGTRRRGLALSAS